MKSLDELMADKIYELVNYMLAKRIKPDISLVLNFKELIILVLLISL